MKLRELMEIYVAAKQSVGMDFKSKARALRVFLRHVGDIPVTSITPRMCVDFYVTDGRLTRNAADRYYLLRGLFGFAVARAILTEFPLPTAVPRIDSSFQPHIYSHEELRRLLDATAILATPQSRLQVLTFRTLLLLLYAAGLRVSEALNLSIYDVDLEKGELAIRDTKFFKSRQVPIGTDLCAQLVNYRRRRMSELTCPNGDHSPFFATRTGRSLSIDRLERVFRRLRATAGLGRPERGRREQVRLHDLRHTFAVHRLLEWYREGVDVQQRLPWLATYLGHRNLSGTQVYLSLTPDVLGEASIRFSRYAGLTSEVMS